MTAEVKLRTLASADAGLRALLGTPPAEFRWMDTQLRQRSAFPNVTVQRISTSRSYLQQGIVKMSEPRMQIIIRDPSAETTREVAAAIIDFLGTADFASDQQFGSPVTTPRQFPCFVLNQRTGMDYELSPPVFTHVLDVRLYNLED